MRTTMVLFLATLAVAAAGCSRAAESVAERVAEEAVERAAGGKAEVDVSDDQVRIESEEGTIVVGGGAELPEGFPLPVADGGEIMGSTSFSTEELTQQTVSLRYPADDADRVITFYENWARANLEDLATTDFSSDGTRLVGFGGTLADGTEVSILVTVEAAEVVVNLTTGSG